MKYLITLGIPPEQVTLAIPMFGRWYNVADENRNAIGSPINGPSMTVPYSAVRVTSTLASTRMSLV